MENRSLNEFLNTESSQTDTEQKTRDTDAGGPPPPSTTAAAETTTVTATCPTMDWTPEGAVCEACSETVQRRWCDTTGGTERLVCPACKPWE